MYTVIIYHFFLIYAGQPVHPDPPSPGPDDEDNDVNYQGLLQDLKEKWLLTQLTHNVSAAATNSFWDLGLSYFPALIAEKLDNNVKKDVPGFIHLRRGLYEDMCPEVHMKYAYLKKSTQEIQVIYVDKCPSRDFPRRHYTKLFEEAHIKVQKHLYLISMRVTFICLVSTLPMRVTYTCLVSTLPMRVIFICLVSTLQMIMTFICLVSTLPMRVTNIYLFYPLLFLTGSGCCKSTPADLSIKSRYQIDSV